MLKLGFKKNKLKMSKVEWRGKVSCEGGMLEGENSRELTTEGVIH